jgi:hypothetical protein
MTFFRVGFDKKITKIVTVLRIRATVRGSLGPKGVFTEECRM